MRMRPLRSARNAGHSIDGAFVCLSGENIDTSRVLKGLRDIQVAAKTEASEKSTCNLCNAPSAPTVGLIVARELSE